MTERRNGAQASSETEGAALDAHIAAVLERRPQVEIAPGFAARVATAAAAQRVAPAALPLRWGPRAAMAATILLVGLMLALAAAPLRGQVLPALVETICLLEFVGALYGATRLRRLWG